MVNYAEGEEVEVKEEKVFDVELTPLFYTQAPGPGQQNHRSNRLQHTSVSKQAVHFWRKGASFSDTVDYIEYDPSEERNSTYPRWKHLMSNNPSLLQEERVCNRNRGESGFKLLMGPDQKNTVWIKYIVQKTTKPVTLVVVACAGIFSVAKACMLLPVL